MPTETIAPHFMRSGNELVLGSTSLGWQGPEALNNYDQTSRMH